MFVVVVVVVAAVAVVVVGYLCVYIGSVWSLFLFLFLAFVYV